MLDPEAVDLRSLGEALEDHSYATRWFLDPRSGAVEPWPGDDMLAGEDDEEPGEHLISIDPIPSHIGYGDMEDFIARVRDPRAREILARAIGGRGAFRRFKDALFEFTELREAWFTFHDTRMQRRAIDWLRDDDLVEDAAAEAALAKRPDPELPVIAGPFDPLEIARRVAADLKDLYRDRLRGVLLFGSWARGDAHPESDLDLLVVLDQMESIFVELKVMRDILWRHSFENDTVITALPVTEAEAEAGSEPVIVRALADGHRVA